MFSRLTHFFHSPYEHIRIEATQAILCLRKMDRYIWGVMRSSLFAAFAAVSSAPFTNVSGGEDEPTLSTLEEDRQPYFIQSIRYILDATGSMSPFGSPSPSRSIMLLKKLNRRPPNSFGVMRRWCAYSKRFQYKDVCFRTTSRTFEHLLTLSTYLVGIRRLVSALAMS